MKKQTHLDIWAKEIVKKTGFVLEKEIYRGYYYSKDYVRNLIFSGVYKGKSAVLKIYDDPRLCEEPNALAFFNKKNKSKILKAPKIYAFKMVSLKKGWLIMERLPRGSKEFQRPVKREYRKIIADLYLEYRKVFPVKPNRELVLAENLTAHQFQVFRISRWLELCNNAEAERMLKKKKTILDPKEFIPRFEKGMDLIYKEFKKRKMIWCHGHFNPAELFKAPSKNLYFLIDFAHAHMYPEGYEFGFIIWSDWLMHADWKMKYSDWKKGINDWIKEFKRINKKLKIKNLDSLIKASLVERCLGMILVDICASDRPDKEKRERIKRVYMFLDTIL